MSVTSSVGSAQINNGFSGQFYFPYSIGLLQAYFLKHSNNPDRYCFKPTIYKRIPLSEIVNQLVGRDVVLFSVYVWNINISIEVARELKLRNQEVFIIFGGPSVPDSAKEFLLSNSCIDVACHQEGERTLTSVLDAFPNSSWQDTHGISYIDNKGEFRTNVGLPRMKDGSDIPSPYLEKIFDPLIKENLTEKWLASWETNRGCPFACAFCDWGSAVNSKVSRMEMSKLKAELEWFAKNNIEFLFVCDANFGMLKRDYEIAEHAVEVRKRYGYPHVLSVQATKNAGERSYRIQKLLYDGGLHRSVTLSMQSTNPSTLQDIKRGNISLDDYRELQRRFLRDGIPTYSDLIIGLPGDTYESFVNSIEELISSGQHYRVQFNNLSILPNAEMAQREYLHKHQIKTVQIPIINMHGSFEETPEDGILEHQDLVISTKDMPTKEWIRVRQYATTTEFFYFNKVLQVPILLCNIYQGVPFREVFEKFMNIADAERYPVLSSLNDAFCRHATDITNGKPEFLLMETWLNIYWPPGEYAILKLVEDGLIDDFYDESERVLKEISGKPQKSDILIAESVLYNKELLKLPGNRNDLELQFTLNIDAMYKSALVGKKETFEQGAYRYIVRREREQYKDLIKWAKEVLWYGHRRAAYLYGCESMELDIAGHY